MTDVQRKFIITDHDAETLLYDLVNTPSVSHHEGEAVNVLVQWMGAHGYARVFPDDAGNAVGIIGEGDGSHDIVLLGHIDTFPGFPPVKVDGRLLYGRGSVDAKGPLATFAVAAANLRESLPDGVRIIVIGAVEEEAASSKGALYAATQYKPRLCVIGEPSHWDRFTLGYKGRVLMEWRWEGGFSHSAGEAPSAGENAFAYWRRIMDYANACNAGKTAVFEQLTPSLREINTGSSGYGTHQWAQMTLGIRLPLGIDPYQLVRDLAPTDDARLRAYGHEVAFASEKDNALTRALRGAIREAGSKPRFLYKTGTADMNVVGPRWGCPIVAYGPGDSALDHTPHEHLDLDEYGRAVQVLTSALTRLAGEA